MPSIKEQVGIKGHYRLTECDPLRAPELYEKIVRLIERGEQVARELLDEYHAKALVAVHEFDNLIPTVGQSVIAQRLANVTTYTGIVNYAAVGSNTTTPNISDTQLGTETYRQTLTSQTYLDNIAYLSCFIVAGSATGTHKEAGLFIDGGAGANTGQLLSHVAIDITKGASNSLTLDIALTVS
ncbi:MAG: hypothetical protein WCV84_04720 [Patescibacteria group bacterium]